MTEPEPGADRGAAAGARPFAAVVAIVVLVAGGLWLVRVLSSAGSIQDYVASGRTNCAPIAAPAH